MLIEEIFVCFIQDTILLHSYYQVSGPLSDHQQNAIKMAFYWLADSGPRWYAGWDVATYNNVQSTSYSIVFILAHWSNKDTSTQKETMETPSWLARI